jgi:hypothetical protein
MKRKCYKYINKSNKMKNIFCGFTHSLDLDKESRNKVEDMSIETSQAEMQVEETKKSQNEKRTKYTRKLLQLQKTQWKWKDQKEVKERSRRNI